MIDKKKPHMHTHMGRNNPRYHPIYHGNHDISYGDIEVASLRLIAGSSESGVVSFPVLPRTKRQLSGQVLSNRSFHPC